MSRRRYSEALPYLDSLLHCLICTEEYVNPKVLPCQHTFCEKCLQRHYEYQYTNKQTIRNKLTCPTCRHRVLLPKDGIAGLPNDFKVGQVRDFFQHLPSKTKTTDCDVCRYGSRNVDASFYCVQCAKYLCIKCQDYHSSNAIFQSHNSVGIAPMDVSILRCSDHKEEVRYFCFNCNCSICTVCALSVHRSHQFKEVPQAMHEQRRNLQSHVSFISQKLNDYSNKSQQLAQLKEDWNKQRDSCRQQIQATADALVAKVRTAEKEYLELIELAVQEKLAQVEQEEETVILKVNSIESLKVYVSGLSSENTGGFDLFESYPHIIKRILHAVGEKTEDIPANLQPNLEFLPSNTFTVGNDMTLGQLMLPISKKEGSPDKLPIDRPALLMEAIEEEEPETEDKPVKKKVSKGFKKSTGRQSQASNNTQDQDLSQPPMST